MRVIIKRMTKNRKSIFAYMISLCLLVTSCLNSQTVYAVFGMEASHAVAEAETKVAGSGIALKKLSGSGTGFIYNHFVETKQFKKGETYALLDGIYGYEEAVASLGSGAVLKAGSDKNRSIQYIQDYYGEDAKVTTYVDVVTKGKQFDYCTIGGLYAVPNSGTPTEYRYYCGFGGAQNCGPLYAYSYEKVALGYESISASLNHIDKQGSTNSGDYTVKITYQGQELVLEPSSYRIQMNDSDSDAITIVVEDSEGNEITTNFSGPLAVRYEANANGVTGIPISKEVWKGKSTVISSATPVRAGGYSFQGWKDKKTGVSYAKGATITSLLRCLWLQAQWKDVQKPNVTYEVISVPGRTADADVKAAVRNSLTITDNEPVSECTVTIGGSNIAGTAGDRSVTVTVTDKAGNTTTKNCVVKVVPLPLQFENITFNTSSKQLQATLREPGPDAVTETGFVWGIMSSPTTSLNNGKAATSPAVTSSGGKLTVTAGNLQKGVNYYARAYAVAGGVAYYSDEITIGIGIPAYGTFSIKNNGNNTFTVTRSGGSEGAQTVYYRTVNGSAVGGTHFTHKAEALSFQAGETSKTITITENGVNAAYSGKPATAYTNADRTYQVQLYRVTGGASLGNESQSIATRTLAKNTNYTIDRAVYTKYKEETNSEWWGRVTDANYGNNPVITFSMYPAYGSDNLNKYLKNTATAQALYILQDIWEEDDGYQYIKFYTPEGYVSEWKFEIKPDGKGGTHRYNAHFPCNSVTAEDVKNFEQKASSPQMPFVSGENYLSVPISVQTMNIGFDASGSLDDDWRYENTRKYVKPLDTSEPQCVTVAPMAGGLYKAGDKFTVALIFDEIVDKTNSTGIGSVSLDTSWGPASYSGGVNTNVLYFSGTVKSGANTTLKVNKISAANNIKDMCDTSGTASSGSGSVTAQVDTSEPAFAVASNGVSGGTGSAKITVNDDKSKTNALRYAWSNSTAMPVTGWVEANAAELSTAKTAAGLPLSIRKTPGSGDNGKWYLHVIGTYDKNGATTYKMAAVDFGTVSSPAAGSVAPSLEISVNNANWATSRQIGIQASGGQTLKYRATGETSWKTLGLTATSVTVTENGYYTFMLTADDQTVTKSVQVEKIDKKKPSAGIGILDENGTIKTAKEGVYTKITLLVQYADEDSGVKTVQYAWTNSTSTPSSWSTLGVGASQITYTASESAETAKYLHLKVTDNVGYINTARSLPFTVISENAVNNKAPGITLTGAPTKWTNDMPTLSWKLSNYSGKKYTVTQPNGKVMTKPNGEFLATQNGTYTVTVQDEDYGRTRQASVTVDKLDITPPDVNVAGVTDGWKSSAQNVTLSVSDSQSGVGDRYYEIVEGNDEIPEEGLVSFTGSSKSVQLNQNGTWYVYYKCLDQTGDSALGRPANQTEGFAGPVRIDTTPPALSVTGGQTGVPVSDGLELEIHAGYGPSGGTMKVGNTVLEELGAEESEGSTGPIVDGSYTVNAKGNYLFQVTSGAGKTQSRSVTVHQADFQYQNGDATQSQLVVKGGKLTEPEEPVRAGYVFTGWYTQAEGGTKWDFGSSPLNANTVLYARWRANAVAVQTYKDGQLWQQNPLSYSLRQPGNETVITDFDAVPNGTYQVFEGETDTGKSVTVQDATASVRLDYYTVTFYDGDKVSSTEIVREGNPVPEPQALIKTGYSFEKWVTGGSEDAFDFNQDITGTTNLYAVWSQNGYKVTFEYEGATGGNEVENIYVKYGNLYAALPVPERTGYTFKGWYTEAEGKGSLVTNETTVTAVTDHSLYAYWLDETPPEAPALPDGVTLPDDWTNQTKIPLVLKDGVGVSELLVRVDDGGYVQVPDFESSSTEYSYPVLEGEHTYQFIARDEAGNESEMSPLYVMKVDLVSPEAEIVLGVNSWNEFLNDITFGLFFDEVQTVTINTSDNTDSVKEVWYYLADKEIEDTSAIKDWQPYTDMISIQPGKYVIYAKAADAAGNTIFINSDGLVVDMAAPDVRIGNEPVKDQKTYYGEQILTVEDEWLKAVTVNGADITDEIRKNGSYTISLSEDTVSIAASDKSGNAVSYTIWVVPKKEQQAPDGLEGISETIDGKKDGSIKGVTAQMEYRMEGDSEYTKLAAEAIPNGTLEGLAPGTYYVRYAETDTSLASPDSTAIVIEAGKKLTVTFMADGEAVVIKKVSYDEKLTDIPSVPEKEGFTGKWCDEAGNDAVFEHIRKDIVITAVYTEISKPEETGKPGETPEPGETSAPEETEKPGETAEPGQTGEPQVTNAPAESGKPQVTQPPVPTDGTYQTVSSPNPNVPKHTKEPDREEKTKKPKQSVKTKDAEKSEKTSESEETQKLDKSTKTAKTRKAAKTADIGKTGKTPGSDSKERSETVTQDEEPAAFSGTEVATGNLGHMANTKTELPYGGGKVVVTVVCEEKKFAAGVTDTEAVARMVLSPEQLMLVSQGETIEIEIHVKDISAEVPEQDKQVVGEGIKEFQNEISGLTLGAYVDISMSVRVGDSDWQTVTQTKEPIEIVVGIPESLRSTDKEYAIIRAHEGEYALLRDSDKEQDTITIQTGMFSTYAIVHGEDIVEEPACSLCHICPTFLGICCFIWLALALLVIAAVLYLHRKRQRQRRKRDYE